MLTMKTKMTALVLIPSVIVLFFAFDKIVEKKSAVNEMDELQQLSQLSGKISAYVHELQKERGYTGLFMVNVGKKFFEELTVQYKLTDTKEKELKDFLSLFDSNCFGTEFEGRLHNALTKTENIRSHRSNVKPLTLSDTDAIRFYTELNKLMLNVIRFISKVSSNAEVSNQVHAYVNFLEAKEKAGLERVVLSKAFVADNFSFKIFRELSSLVTAQDILFDTFRSFANSAATELFTQKMSAPTVAETRQMRNMAFERFAGKTVANVDADHWFRVMTEKINLMKIVEDRLTWNLDEYASAISKDARKSLFLSVFVVSILTVMLIFFTYFLHRSIIRPLNIAIGELTSNSERLISVSDEVSQSSLRTAEDAKNQAASLEDVSVSLEEMAAMTKMNAVNANQADIMTKKMSNSVEEGLKTMRYMVSVTEGTKHASDKTSDIIKIIDGIAFQTNLLALNAAVEAAHAGDAGRGFAVVAEEVANLARRSTEAAREVASLIEVSRKNAENGVSTSEAAAETLRQTADTMKKTAQLVSEISTGNNEQAKDIHLIKNTMLQLDEITQSGSVIAESTAVTSRSLKKQADALNKVVNVLVRIIGSNAFNNDQAIPTRRAAEILP